MSIEIFMAGLCRRDRTSETGSSPLGFLGGEELAFFFLVRLSSSSSAGLSTLKIFPRRRAHRLFVASSSSAIQGRNTRAADCFFLPFASIVIICRCCGTSGADLMSGFLSARPCGLHCTTRTMYSGRRWTTHARPLDILFNEN